MPYIAQALTDLCTDLRLAGLNAAVDAEDVQVPGAWVTARDLARPTLAGSWEVTVHTGTPLPAFQITTTLDL
jgi:hypothetical protein